jgi:hypothetical protein
MRREEVVGGCAARNRGQPVAAAARARVRVEASGDFGKAQEEVEGHLELLPDELADARRIINNLGDVTYA